MQKVIKTLEARIELLNKELSQVKASLDESESQASYEFIICDIANITSEINEHKKAIDILYRCKSDNEQLHTEVFKLANKLAINGYGNEAVKMHLICNGMYKNFSK